MHILSIGKAMTHPSITFTTISEGELATCCSDLSAFDYLLISGGDGTIRRVLTQLQHHESLPPLILDPTGSFNVVAKLHRVPKVQRVLERLSHQTTPPTQPHHYYRLNDHLFLFSAGNMGDLQHIFLAETLRFGWLKRGMAKYLIALLFLLPLHLMMTPFMLMSQRRFFIFTPARFIKKLGNFYGEVPQALHIDLENDYNLLELDGDIVTIPERHLHISRAGTLSIVVG